MISEEKKQKKTGCHSVDVYLSKHRCRRLGAKPSQEREEAAGRAVQQLPAEPPCAEEKHKTEIQ